MRKFLRLVTCFLAFIIFFNAEGQFYNGHQMTFGKNRVQYYDYYWQFYRFDDFDCYFNEYGREIAQFTAAYAMKKLDEIEDYFDYDLEKRLILIVFNKNNEYRQSNIGLVTYDEESYNTGGFSRIIQNKVMLYYEGDHVSFQKQIAASITESIINEMLYNADFKNRISSSSVIYMPDWYIKGLINYVSWGWDYEVENRVKDGIKSGKYKNINHLEFDDAVYAGQSFWRFIGRKYGETLIPNIIYLTKVYKNIDDGLFYATGVKFKDLLAEWKEYYAEEFKDDRNMPSDEAGTTLAKSKKEQIFQQVKISPDRKYIAWVTNDWGKKRIWLFDQATGKSKVIFKAEPKYEHKTDTKYPVIAWHPAGSILTFLNEEKAGMVIYFYRTEEEKTEQRNFLYFDKVLDFAYSPEGTRLVMSAVKDGVTDIYIHTVASGTNEQITRDVADDLNPVFMKNHPNTILFSSNRISDTLSNTADPFEKLSSRFDLFSYNLDKRDNVLVRLAEEGYAAKYQPSEDSGEVISFIGDGNGILNRYTAVFDSAISYIDTAMHYRYFIRSAPATNYDRNIINQSLPGSQFAEVLFKDNKFMLRKGSRDERETIPASEINLTNFRKEQNLMFHREDSIETIRKWLIAEAKRRRDTLTKPWYEYLPSNEPININHYIFEKEKQNYYDLQWRKDYMDIDLDTGKIDIPLIRIYETSFYNNYIANQIDFTFLNNTYQVFNGGSGYYNPGINLLTRFGILDLFEDYRLTAGVRFAGDFDSNEYLLSFESLKGRYDKQFIFHRQAYFSQDELGYLYKTHTHNAYIGYTMPITPVLALKGTLSYRNDRYVVLALDYNSLNAESITRHWGGLKGEVIYDNTRKRAVNIYFGTRFKVFGEYYRQIPEKKSDMFVIGGDFRHYIRIHRELIWANRFAASSSFGPTKLVYYLGGVDNWMGYLFNKYDMFDRSMPVSQNQNYGFQALATNMRGFTQNIRNGNNFALINSEIRWPFVRYFAGHPLKSNFLNSLQIVAFGDIGTAWTGRDPWSGKNSWDTETKRYGPVTVVLDSNRDPIVAGFGAGLRAQLLGYFVRADWAWGIENRYILPRIFYLSFSLDF